MLAGSPVYHVDIPLCLKFLGLDKYYPHHYFQLRRTLDGEMMIYWIHPERRKIDRNIPFQELLLLRNVLNKISDRIDVEDYEVPSANLPVAMELGNIVMQVHNNLKIDRYNNYVVSHFLTCFLFVA